MNNKLNVGTLLLMRNLVMNKLSVSATIIALSLTLNFAEFSVKALCFILNINVDDHRAMAPALFLPNFEQKHSVHSPQNKC